MLRRLTSAAVLAALCTLLPVAPALAQDEPDWYRVEVIVFRQSAPSAADDEAPVADAPRPAYRQLTVLHESGPRAFRRLQSGAMQLQGAASRLDASPDYEVLAHFGWLQPALTEDEAVSIALPLSWQPGALAFNATTHRLGVPVVTAERQPPPASGDDRPATPGRQSDTASQSDQPDQTETETETDESAPDTAAITNNVFASVPMHARLYGTLTVFRGRYLHVDADLRLRPEDPPAEPEADRSLLPERVYVMRQRRRMRSDELHYLDHPELGLLVKITPAPATEDQSPNGGGSQSRDDGAQ